MATKHRYEIKLNDMVMFEKRCTANRNEDVYRVLDAILFTLKESKGTGTVEVWCDSELFNIEHYEDGERINLKKELAA